MQNTRKITDDLFWLGSCDRRLALFENVYPVPDGVSYNSYLILDEKTVLLDTADRSVSGQFFENLTYALDGRKLDYVIVNHMEPDHAASLEELIMRCPEVKIVGNAKTFTMMKQFFDFDTDSRAVAIKEGESLETGKHKFTFYMAPMVHWPEAMVTFDETSGTLFSADAFGTFGALSGNIFADEVDFEHKYLAEARRYYTNIVGKYGAQTETLLKKASGLPIKMICPLHGFIWRENIGWFVNKYLEWACYKPEGSGVVIFYGSIYGGTENAANILASDISEAGVKDIEVYDVSSKHVSYLVAEAFRAKVIVFASATYNGGIFTPMENLLLDLKAHNLRNRQAAVIENGTWAPSSGKQIKEILSSMKDISIFEDTISLRSSVKSRQREQILALAKAIAASISSI